MRLTGVLDMHVLDQVLAPMLPAEGPACVQLCPERVGDGRSHGDVRGRGDKVGA